MTFQGHTTPTLADYVDGRCTRSQLLQGAAAGLTLAALPSGALAAGSPGRQEFPFFPQTKGSYTPESVDEIVSNILTFLYFETSAFTFILSAPPLLTVLGLTGLPLAFTQALAAEMQDQLDFWSAAVPSAGPKKTNFTVNPALLGSAKAGLAAFELASTLRVGMMVTAVREFAELGQPTLAKNAAQALGLHAEERVLSRMLQVLSGVGTAIPPNNKAFETDLFLFTRDAIGILTALLGSGVTVSYPGRDAVVAATGAIGHAILQSAPNNASSTVEVTGLGSLLGERA